MLQVKLEKPTPTNSFMVPLTHGKFAIVDLRGASKVFHYKWRAIKWHKKWYAYSTKRLDGTPVRIAMHRLIAETPPGEVTHHLNRNSLDNRLANLLNMTNRHHGELHKIRRWGHARNPRSAKTR